MTERQKKKKERKKKLLVKKSQPSINIINKLFSKVEIERNFLNVINIISGKEEATYSNYHTTW